MSASQTWRIGILTIALTVAPGLRAQQAQKPLTNQDLVKMAKAGLSESVVVATIQANPGNYDTSTDGVIELKKNGVTDNEIRAILAAQQGGNGASAAPSANGGGAAPPAQAPPAAPGPKWQMPTVTLEQQAGAQEIPREKTQLAETKTKPTSMASLAGDSAVTQGIQAGVNEATYGVASRMNSSVGGSAVQQGGSIFGGMLASRKPTVTYVWGVPGPASANVLQTTTPKFSVNFATAPGVAPSEFAPEIVRLTPAQNTCRLIGATRGKEDARSHDAADWEIYSGFVEDRILSDLEKTAEGQYVVSPHSPLYPGEYAIVLRPVSKDEKFSGGDVARGQGPGMMFDTVWTFQVAENAQ